MESQSAPLVSIYIPTHNRCAQLKKAIASVFSQTYTNLELLIVDDASTDDTANYLQQLSHQYISVRVFKLNTRSGACTSRNKAIQHAKGVFLTGLDDDDEFLPNRIHYLVSQYDANFSFVCTGFLWDYGKRRRKVDCNAMTITLEDQLNYNYSTNQVLVELERMKSINGFDDNFVACQDYDTWTRLIKKFGPAKRAAGASYIIHRDVNLERISKPNNWLRGHQQFLKKHSSDMTPKNLLNQEFTRIIAKRQVLPLRLLFKQLAAGLATQKIRYFLSSNFKSLANIRRRFIAK